MKRKKPIEMHKSNSVGVAKHVNTRKCCRDIVDGLPLRVKIALWENVMDWNDNDIVERINKSIAEGLSLDSAYDDVIEWLRMSDNREIYAFSRQYERQHRISYPHTAAIATIQPYESKPQ